MPCTRTLSQNLRGEKHDISMKIRPQAGLETRTAGGDIGKTPRSNHFVMYLSVPEYIPSISHTRDITIVQRNNYCIVLFVLFNGVIIIMMKYYIMCVSTLSNLNLNPLHPLQAANCCRNSRLVADEDDLKWLANKSKIST